MAAPMQQEQQQERQQKRQLGYAEDVIARREDFANLGAKPLIPIPKMDPHYMFKKRAEAVRKEEQFYPLAQRPPYRALRDDTGAPPPKRTKLLENDEQGGRRRKSRKSRKTRRRRHGRKTRRVR